MSNKLVSIIMGVYNCENRIEECIESIQAQTYTNWELIICDDCSVDNTFSVISDISKKESRIKVIRNQTNSKLAFSLNHCLEYAKGEYIARMDDDDICYPMRLETQVNFLENNLQYDAVGSLADVYNGKNIVGIRKTKKNPEPHDLIWGPCHIHPTVMVRKKAYDRLGGYTVSQRTQRGQDWDLWFRFYSEGMKGYNLQVPLIKYHESKEDKKKRTLKTAWMYTRTALYGYRLIRVPIYSYIFAFKPIISTFLPNALLDKYHNN